MVVICKSASLLLFLLLLAVLLVVLVHSHPQCLDGKPPFKPVGGLEFCKEYADFGCCTKDEERKILAKHEDLSQTTNTTECRRYLKTVLCQKCSPYAAHLYSFEETGEAAPFPGLCKDFCADVYKTCEPQVFKKFSNDGRYRSSLTNVHQFCSYIQTADNDYCYPELKTNPVLNRRFIEQTLDTPGCMCLQKIADNHGIVTFIESNPSGDGLVYVGEQRGIIYVYDEYGVKKYSRPFLDLSQDVLLSRAVGDERGLLGMAFHPNFATDRRFYLYYVYSKYGQQTVRISQWYARSRRRAKANSETVLLDIPQPYFNHNGGQLLFGDDGYLYIFTGDGGGAGDPQNNSQDKTTLLGKALRIDVSRRRGYTIPPDNPFRDGTSQEEIYAYGLRNPWRCSVDKGDPRTGKEKGRIFCADVGQNKFEEIDLIVKGGNYGWGYREGYECYQAHGRPNLCGQLGSEELPIHVYDHSYGKSITGGYVYRGCDFPAMNGAYIYGDYVSGRLFKLYEKYGRWRNEEIKMCSPGICSGNWVSTYGRGITTFGMDSHMDVFMASSNDMSAYSKGSTVYKLIMQPLSRADPTSCLNQSRLRNHSVRGIPAGQESESSSGDEETSDNLASITKAPYYQPRTAAFETYREPSTETPAPSENTGTSVIVNTELPEILQTNILGLPDELFLRLRDRYLRLLELEAVRSTEIETTTERPTIGISSRKRQTPPLTLPTPAAPSTRIKLEFGTTKKRYWWQTSATTERTTTTTVTVTAANIRQVARAAEKRKYQSATTSAPKTATKLSYVHVNKITDMSSPSNKNGKPRIIQYNTLTTTNTETYLNSQYNNERTTPQSSATKHAVHLLFSHDDFDDQTQTYAEITEDSMTKHPEHLLFSHHDALQRAPAAPSYHIESTTSTTQPLGFVTSFELPDYLKSNEEKSAKLSSKTITKYQPIDFNNNDWASYYSQQPAPLHDPLLPIL